MSAFNDIQREAKRDGQSETISRLLDGDDYGQIEQAIIDAGLLLKCPCGCLNPEWNETCDECQTDLTG